jgi:hypothetical protein
MNAGIDIRPGIAEAKERLTTSSINSALNVGKKRVDMPSG